MRFWGMICFGVVGTAILVSLGIWQVQRLASKQDTLAQIEEQIVGAVQPLPQNPNPDDHTYQPVSVTGTYGTTAIRVLVSRKLYGAGFRLISDFETDGRRILVDRGFIKQYADIPAAPKGEVVLEGNLHWPQEVDGFTPDPDWDDNFHFARDVPNLAARIGTENTLIILRNSTPSEPAITPLPVSSQGIPNDHLQYAVTWFGLALIWVGMSGYFLYRNRRTQA